MLYARIRTRDKMTRVFARSGLRVELLIAQDTEPSSIHMQAIAQARHVALQPLAWLATGFMELYRWKLWEGLAANR